MTTMRDVARRASVSIFTVSSVVNKSAYVSEPLKSRVLQAMDELNYRPNAIARSLRRRRTNTVGMLIFDVLNPYYMGLVKAVEEVLRAENYNVILCGTGHDPDTVNRVLKLLQEQRVDGILSTAGVSAEQLDALCRHNISLVYINHDGEDTADSVVMDNVGAGFQVTDYLLAKGADRITAVLPSIEEWAGRQRVQGYRAAAAAHGLAPEALTLAEVGFEVEEAERGSGLLLDQPLRPSALIGGNNRMTLGLLRALRSRGLVAGADVLVAGIGDLDWARLLDPPLPVVSLPTHQLGHEAARLLLERMAATASLRESDCAELGEIQRIVLPTRLIV